MKKILVFLCCCALLGACSNKKKDESKTEGTTMGADTSKAVPQSEFADQKYVQIGKTLLNHMSSGNVDSWLDAYSDSAVYQWSNGDSLKGKAAIEKYWKSRRMGVIDSLVYTTDIWLPIKVNRPQQGPDAPGIWLLGWYMVNVKYHTGKRLVMWTHVDHHFDANDKIDRSIQYIDFAPINKATGK